MENSGHTDRPARTGARRSTRAEVLDALAGSAGGLTASELGSRLGLRPNAARKHLRALAAAGAVAAVPERPEGRGRPAVRHRVAGAAGEDAAARGLARMLVELAAEVGADPAAVEELGRRHGARRGPAADGRSVLLGHLADMGFGPEDRTHARAAASGRLEAVLRGCPYRHAVESPGGDLVCALHRGMTRGLVESAAGGRLTAFEARPPREGACRVAAEGLGPPARPRGGSAEGPG